MEETLLEPAQPTANMENVHDVEVQQEKSQNTKLLAFAFVTFLLFAIAEIVAALSTGSLSLLADAATMVVDAATYGFNSCAERKKVAATEKFTLQLELFVPLFSLVALVGVSVYVIWDATQTLHSSEAESDAAKDSVMLVFSIVNLVIDIFNIAYFAMAGRLNGFVLEISNEDGTQVVTKKTNMNMCSAYTHVLADTLRSLAVMVAAILSMMIASIDSDVADAYAALAVSVIIFFSLGPLVRGLFKTWRRLRASAGSGAAVEGLDERIAMA